MSGGRSGKKLKKRQGSVMDLHEAVGICLRRAKAWRAAHSRGGIDGLSAEACLARFDEAIRIAELLHAIDGSHEDAEEQEAC